MVFTASHRILYTLLFLVREVELRAAAYKYSRRSKKKNFIPSMWLHVLFGVLVWVFWHSQPATFIPFIWMWEKSWTKQFSWLLDKVTNLTSIFRYFAVLNQHRFSSAVLPIDCESQIWNEIDIATAKTSSVELRSQLTGIDRWKSFGVIV